MHVPKLLSDFLVIFQSLSVMMLIVISFIVASKSIEVKFLKYTECLFIFLIGCLILEELMYFFNDTFYVKNPWFPLFGGLASLLLNGLMIVLLRKHAYWILVNVLLSLIANSYLISSCFKP